MGNNLEELREKINKKEARIAVVGLGYVGLPLALEFARVGFAVAGIEIDKGRLICIKEKKSYITDISDEELKRALASGRFSAGGRFQVLKEIDVIIICVPTPLKRKYHPNISYIRQAVKSIGRNLKAGSLIILESTTYPGTTEEVILPLLENNNLKHNKDFYLSFSPERIDPGNRAYPVRKIPKVVGGISPQARGLAEALYKKIIEKVVAVSSARTAEAAKLLENTFRLVNIGLIDELAMMLHKMDIDIWEVIRAASTKPFGFMPFYPGPGVGGHCLDANETIFVKDGHSLKVMQLPRFIKYIESAESGDIEILSFDPIKRRSVFKKVIAASARPYSGEMIDITTKDGRHLKVTDLHPMFTYHDRSWQLKYAKDLQNGDLIPVCLGLPKFNNSQTLAEIDLIEQLWQKAQSLIDRVRIKPLGFFWRDYAKEIKSVLRKDYGDKLPDTYWDYLADNVLPLNYLYNLEKLIKIDHHRLKLVTGRGPSYSEIPAIIKLDKDFCRLLGYYLSEGCHTKDKSRRIRFSFNRNEVEYIQDVIAILQKLGIRTSVYESRLHHASSIKVSSNLFGFLICEVLGCGNNCYNMNIPEQIFSLDREKKKALLAGVFRGDGCVEHFFGKWRYHKNEKEYLHNVNTASISFFTASKKLFQQLTILLQDLNIVPTFKKRKYTLSIFGYKQLSFFRDLFGGKKREIIEKYLESNRNRPKNKTFKKLNEFAIVKVKSVSLTKGGWVYSIETDKPHSFVTSYGIVVHNCIPKDPLYLYWKARHHGFHSRFIKLAANTISSMPGYIAKRIEDLLKKSGKRLKGSRILVVGVTYKKNIKDLRKSPALDIIEKLKEAGADVSYYDPLIPYLDFNRINLKSIKLQAKDLSRLDCLLIATDHSDIDYKFLLKYSKLIFDTRDVYRGSKSKKVVLL